MTTMMNNQNHQIDQLQIKRNVAQCTHARDVKTRHDERNSMVMVLRIDRFFAFYDVSYSTFGVCDHNNWKFLTYYNENVAIAKSAY
jgi:hypothetical protein